MENRLTELKRKKAKKERERRNRRKTLEMMMQKRIFTANDRKEFNKQVTKLRRNNKLKSMIGFKPMTEKKIQNTAFRQIKSRKRKKMKNKYSKAKNPNPINNLLQNLRSSFKPLGNVKVVMTTPQRLPTPRELSRRTGSKRFVNSKTLKIANTI